MDHIDIRTAVEHHFAVIDSVLAQEEISELRQAFLRLRWKDQDLLWQAYVKRSPRAVIAVHLGVSPSAARKRVERALLRLREAIGAAEGRASVR